MPSILSPNLRLKAHAPSWRSTHHQADNRSEYDNSSPKFDDTSKYDSSPPTYDYNMDDYMFQYETNGDKTLTGVEVVAGGGE